MICLTQAEPDVEMEARCYWVSTFTPPKCGSFYFMTAPQSSEVCTWHKITGAVLEQLCNMKQAEDMCHLPMQLKDIDAVMLFLLEVEPFEKKTKKCHVAM